MAVRQTPLTCHGHTRPVVRLHFSDVTDSGYFVISACKGIVNSPGMSFLSFYTCTYGFCSLDGKPMLRQGDTGDWIGTFEGHKGAVWGVALSHDASKAASGAADFSAKVSALNNLVITAYYYGFILLYTSCGMPSKGQKYIHSSIITL